MKKSLCEISNPKQWKTISTDMLTETGYPVYGANGIIGYYSTYNHDCETLLITCRGATCGSLNICQPFSYVNGNAMALDSLSADIDIRYLYYYLLNRGLNDVITGSAQPQIVRQSLEKVIVEYPELNIQKSIVETLDKISKIISLRKQQLSKLDELVKSRFIELFGDVINNDKNWPIATMGDVAEIKIGPFGTLLHKEDYIVGGHALVNPSHIIDGKISVDIRLTVSDEKYEELSAYHLKTDDIVLGRRGEMGRCAVVREEGLLCGTGSLIIRPNDKLKPYFLQTIISNPTYKKIIEDKAVGVTMMNLNVPIVESLNVPVLPIELQNDFISFMEQVDKSKLEIQKSLEKLETLKKALMQKYFG